MTSSVYKDPFDNIDDRYKEELTPEMSDALQTAFHHTNMSLLMAELHECILLHISIKQDVRDEHYADNTVYP